MQGQQCGVSAARQSRPVSSTSLGEPVAPFVFMRAFDEECR
jgi:hypothetical protein